MAEDSRSNTLLVVLAAFLVVSVAIGAYVFLNNRPPVLAGQVMSLEIYPIHRDLASKSSTDGLGGETETYDQLLVFAKVRLANQTNIPVFVQDIFSTFDPPEGPQRSGAASQSEVAKVFTAYPETLPFRKDPIPRDVTLQPGQKVEGLIVFHFPISKAQWDMRSNMQIHVVMLHQNAAVIDVSRSAGG